MIATLVDLFGQAQGWLFQSVIEPVIYMTGLGEFTEQAFEGTEWLLIGVLELLLLFVLLRPLEALIPAQVMTDKRARWTDFLYTAIHRLGAFTVVVFFILDPLMDHLTGLLHLEGVRPINLDGLWPGVTNLPLVTFLLYLIVLDFFDYWYHRGEHQVNWWWGLHGLHHSQQNMNLWSDNRNHLLDDFMRDIYMAVIALAIGVPPGQYVLLVAASRILQSLQHANVKLHFGWLGERLLVSPRYHRLHHEIGVGHESAGKGTLGGHNFAVLFPVWDILFRTANFSKTFGPTGIRDQLPAPAGIGRDYGRGFWAQQWLGLKRMTGFDRPTT
ncbi:sterol desaturase family protein [Actimicrobium antarcticum]|uniref:Sterol desaturase family protein n=1 Tax=Actimicrobium antarcticum TaxID=1051899 RepID=A0ABP7SYF8_9BURK